MVIAEGSDPQVIMLMAFTTFCFCSFVAATKFDEPLSSLAAANPAELSKRTFAAATTGIARETVGPTKRTGATGTSLGDAHHPAP